MQMVANGCGVLRNLEDKSKSGVDMVKYSRSHIHYGGGKSASLPRIDGSEIRSVLSLLTKAIVSCRSFLLMVLQNLSYSRIA